MGVIESMKMLKMAGDVKIISSGSGARVSELEDASFELGGKLSEDRKVIFARAYEIERTSWDDGIVDCEYKVLKRRFTDLSCMKGETLEEFGEGHDEWEVRMHEDGTRFLFTSSVMPTFDSADRVWDQYFNEAIYRDKDKVIVIRCSHGYKIPRIRIYMVLEKSVPRFDEYLGRL